MELLEFDPPADIPRYKEDKNRDTYLVGKQDSAPVNLAPGDTNSDTHLVGE